MALAIDGSTPAKATSTNQTCVTASFTPPAGALLIVLYGENEPSGTADASLTSVTNSGTALSWSRLARKNKNAASNGGAGTAASAEIWGAVVGSSAAMTVTTTSLISATGLGHEKMSKVIVLTGADTASLTNVNAASNASGLPSVVVASCLAGSHVLAVSSDWAQAGLGTAGTAQSIIDEQNVAGQITIHAWRTTSVLSGAGSQTMNLTAPAAENYNLCAIEIRDASAVVAAGGGRNHPGRRRGPSNPLRYYRRPRSTETVTVSATVPINLDGSIGPAGALTRQDNKPLAGATTPVGALTRQPGKALAGASTPTGALTKRIVRAFAGAVTPTGALTVTRIVLAAFAGLVAPTGALTKQVGKPLAGTSTPGGALTKQILKTLTGAITPTGALSLTKVILRSFAGSITPTGALTKQVNKPLAGATTPAGALTKTILKTLGGAATPAGVLTLTKVILKTFTGALTPAGALTRQTAKPLIGAVTPTGALTKQPRKTFTATVTSSGTLTVSRLVIRAFGGSIGPTGALTRQARKALGGSITPAAGLTKRVGKTLLGALTAAGQLSTSVGIPLVPAISDADEHPTTGSTATLARTSTAGVARSSTAGVVGSSSAFLRSMARRLRIR